MLNTDVEEISWYSYFIMMCVTMALESTKQKIHWSACEIFSQSYFWHTTPIKGNAIINPFSLFLINTNGNIGHVT